MSSDLEHDAIDYAADAALREDDDLFFPVPPGRMPETWTAFYSGILIGILGGGIASLAPWLSGLLVFIGYSVTALTLRRRNNRFVRALRFGFGIVALCGAALLAAEILYHTAVWHLIAMATERSHIFIGVVFMPWILALLKYGLALARGGKRSAQARRA